jgi:hypothetical protein
MGATGRAARGNPSIEKITAPNEDDVLRVSTRYTEERVSHYKQYGAVKMAERFLSPNLNSARTRIYGYGLHQVKIQEETVW